MGMHLRLEMVYISIWSDFSVREFPLVWLSTEGEVEFYVGVLR